MATSQEIQLRLTAISDFSDVTNDVTQIQKVLEKIKMPPGLKSSFEGIFDNLTSETQKYQKLLDSGFKKKGDITGLEASGTRINNLLKRLKVEMGKISDEDLKNSFNVDPSKLEELSNKAKKLQADMQQALSTGNAGKFQASVSKIAGEMSKVSKTKFASNFLEAFNKGDIKGAEEALRQMQIQFNKFKEGGSNKAAYGAAINEFKSALDAMQGDTKLQELNRQLREVDVQMDNLDADELERFVQTFRTGTSDVNNFSTGVRKLTAEQQRAAQAAQEHQQQIDQFRSQVMYFFSLTNSVQLFRQAVTQALETVKELDKTMTEAAVVTDFSIGDMWDRLPEYSKQAQSLGVSINDMYQATTLYYQQGLKTNEAMALGVETMKMARIAGMDSADATTAMTAALRGFNMELTEASAVKVNDVYSKLAAITAADTNQISTAMEKTASIAASANMEFETTAALLAQIIETTQEAPETAGTAMKTIIARFSEVKQLRDKGLGSGEDDEGEIIDVNKIQTALRSVGISMEKYFAGTEGLDSVLLKLAEKWRTLDFETQRYIATAAAGSRQQSRFIAMMSDYGRTTQLVTEAQNSAGASQEQFNKTLDSMETKLQQLENAWNEFLMGLANQEILKGAVDFLTMLLEGINNLLGAFSGDGMGKAVASLIMIIALLKGAFAGITGIFNSVKSKDSGEVNKKEVQNGEQENRQQGERDGRAYQEGHNKGRDSSKTQTVPDGTAENRKQGEQDGRAYAEGHREGQQGTATSKSGTPKNGQQSRVIPFQPKKDNVNAVRDHSQEVEENTETIEDNTDVQEENNQVIQNGTTALQGLSTGFMLVGSAALGLAAIFQNAGFDEVAEVITGIGVALFSVGGVLSLIASLLPTVQTLAVSAGVAGAVSGILTAEAWKKAGQAMIKSLVPILPILGVIAAIVAAIALVIWGLSAALKSIQENSDEGQLKKLTEQLGDLSAAAEQAKQKLDDITAAKEGLEKIQKTFKGLTKGSQEWKKALMENNQQVLDLIGTYPDLIKYLDKGQSGELIIQEQGWEQILEDQQKNYNALLAGKIATQQNIDDKKLEIKSKKITGENFGSTKTMDFAEGLDTVGGYGLAYGGGAAGGAAIGAIIGALIGPLGAAAGAAIGAGIGLLAGHLVDAFTDTAEEIQRKQTGGMTYSEVNEIGALAASRGLYNATGDLDQKTVDGLLTELKESGKIDEDVNINTFMGYLKTMGSSFDELANEALAVQEAERARIETIIDNIAATSDLIQSSKDLGDVIKDIVANANDGYDDETQKQIDWYIKSLNNKNTADSVYQAYAELMGGTMDADQVKKKVEKGEISKTEIATALASSKQNEKLTKQLESAVKIMTRISTSGPLPKESKNTLTNLLRGQGDALTVGNLKQLSDIKSAKAMKTYLAQGGFTNQDALDMGFENFDEMAREYFGNLSAARSMQGRSDEIFKTLGVEMGKIIPELSSQAYLDAANAAKDLFMNGADIKDINSIFSQVGQYFDLNDVEAEKRDALLTSLVENWGSLEGLEGAQSYWAKELGINSSGLNSLFSAVRDLTQATTSLTAEQIKQKKFVLQDIKKELSSGDLTNVMNEEKMNKLIEAGFDANRFVQTGLDEWTYNGDLYADYIALYGDIIEKEKTQQAAVTREKVDAYKAAGAAIASTKTKDVLQEEFIEATRGDSAMWEAFTSDKSYSGFDYAEIMSQSVSGDQEGLTLMGIDQDNAKAILEDYDEFIKTKAQAAGVLPTGDDATEWSYLNIIDQLKAGGSFGAETLKPIYEAIANSIDESAEIPTDAEGNELTGQELIDYMVNNLLQWDEKYNLTEEELKQLAQNQGLGVASEDGYVSSYSYLGDDKNYNADELAGYEKGLDTLTNKYGAQGYIDSLTAKFSDLREEVVEGGGDMATFNRNIKAMGVDASAAEARMKSFTKILSDQADAIKEAAVGTNEFTKATQAIDFGLADLFKVDTKAIEQAKITAEEYQKLVAGDKNTFDVVSERIKVAALEGYLGAGIDGAQALSAINATVGINGEVNLEALQAQLKAMGSNIDVATAEGQKELQKIFNMAGKSITFNTKQNADGSYSLVSAMANTIDYGSMFKNLSKGGSGGSSSKWINEYDEFYNMVQKINEELRTREKLELRYQRLINRNAASAKKLAEAVNQQLESYKTERLDRTSLLNARKAQMDSILEQYSDVGKYATYSHESGLIQIDWSALEALEGSTNEKLTSRIEDYISKLEEQKDLIQEEEDALDSIEDGVWEIFDQGKDEYFDFEDRVKEALVEERQREIDKLSEINQSINDTNTKVLESMQSQLEETRQIRDNQKEEKEIADKQRKLAYLQQDTSGANAKEIRELQKEINDAQESYTDKLIDQKISDLQKQNEEAAEQRQQQIDIAQAQLDQWKDSADVWNAVHELISQSVDIEGNLMEGSKLENLLKEIEGFEGMSTIQRMDWLNKLETTVATSLAWLESGAMQSLYGMGSKVSFTDASGKEVVGTINKDGDVITEDGRAYSAGSFKIDANTGKISSTDTYDQAVEYGKIASKVTEEAPPVTNIYHNYSNDSGGGFVLGGDSTVYASKTTYKDSEGTQDDVGVTIGSNITSTRYDATGAAYFKASNGKYVKAADIKEGKNVKILGRGQGYTSYQLLGPISLYDLSKTMGTNWLPAYKTGGLADFTGPAWLDGTKSKPEYILNADQTKAFFTLVDVLSGLPVGNSKSTQNNGDNTYDIDINVESIGSDYDVERLADTIKRLINEDARYRNNNTINLMR